MLLISRREQDKLKARFDAVPTAIKREALAALEKNAAEANSYLQTLVPIDEGETKSNTFAFAYKNDYIGEIAMQMQTERVNRSTDGPDKTERIRAILFANGQDYFYGTWRNFKRRWKSRVSRAMTKGAKEFYNV